jgi:hypothetical protein
MLTLTAKTGPKALQSCCHIRFSYSHILISTLHRVWSIRYSAVLDLHHKSDIHYQDDEISLNDGVAPTNRAILSRRNASVSFPQSLHRSLTLPEMLLYFGLTTSSSSIHSITFPQSHEIKCFSIAYTYAEEE